VNQCYADRDALMAAMRELAAALAAKPPLALRGAKEMITYARDHTVADGLNYVATWNAAMLLSTDLDESLAANREKRAPKFRD
jgi:enoyl-CoA hydratase/carnithine racemase